MKKQFYIGKDKVIVEELPGIVALKLKRRSENLREGISLDISSLGAREEDLAISKEDKEGFARAGWVFIRPSERTARSLAAGETPEGTTFAGRVFVDKKKRTLIGTDRLSIQLKPDISDAEAQSIIEKAQLEVINKLSFAPNLFEVRVVSDRDPLDVAAELHKKKEFVFAEPQMIEHIPSRFVPTDPDYGLQWQWKNDGFYGGTAGADIKAEAAWDITRGKGAKIAVIDNGIDVDHEDLKPAIAKGAGYFIDDGIGQSSLKIGTNGFPKVEFAMDCGEDHGTFCAGIAVARANNGINGCGLANEADFMPIACLDDQTGTQTTLARAVAYASNPSLEQAAKDAGLTDADGADVISCSLGPNCPDWPMYSILKIAIDYAVTYGREGLGTPVFWAVSNCSSRKCRPGPCTVTRDKVCSYSNVIAVGRSTRDDTEDGSAFGPELDFLAPGVLVWSTCKKGFGDSTGTSFAAPCAAGLAALIIAIKPSLTWSQVRQIIRDTCDKIGGVTYDGDGHHKKYGFGRINAARAVSRAIEM